MHKTIKHQILTRPSILRRFAAINYDFLLLMAVSITYGLLYIGMNILLFTTEGDGARGILFQIGWLLTLFGFFWYFWTKGGQTTGMRAWRLFIMTNTGEVPKTSQCIARFLLATIGWLLFFTYFFDRDQKMLHDKLSATELILLENPKK